MTFILFVIATLAFLLGAGILELAKDPLQEFEAFGLFLAWVRNY
jgi:hypothetical protein